MHGRSSVQVDRRLGGNTDCCSGITAGRMNKNSTGGEILSPAWGRVRPRALLHLGDAYSAQALFAGLRLRSNLELQRLGVRAERAHGNQKFPSEGRRARA